MQVTYRYQRGQALIESAIFLPLFLLVVFGIIWMVQASTLNERAQLAIRYSGIVSNVASPYDGYSLYALYNNVGTLRQAAPTTCMTPAPDALSNDPSNQAFPGPQSAQFWQPDFGTTTTSCTAATVTLRGGSLTNPLLLLAAQPSITTNKTLPAFLHAAVGNVTSISASENFYMTPDERALLACSSELENDVSASLVGEQQSPGTTSFTMPLPDSNPATALTIDNC